MREKAFAAYLRSDPSIKESTVRTYLSDLRRIETCYKERYGEVTTLYNLDRLEEVERSLRLDPSAPDPLPVTEKRSSIPVYATVIKKYRNFLIQRFMVSDADAPAEVQEIPKAPAYAEGVEGILREARYLTRSRNRALVNAARTRDGCRCQACGYLNFIDNRYIIEVHHLNPLGAAETVVVTRLEDLVCLCPNCHRSAHTKRAAPLTLAELRDLAAA
ncbi:HNH endonuclease [Paracoccus sp. (in: a-proteobacteria)]|uniref:HNH endonuclease n=1 Tax=Paracoccus sp. TaxID=267 RepID=UPI0026E0E885|nr:HNH endonuclease [Paracoccus sp. (in: a-proteobacteria)]MDO5369279.1 HNH endonuclease [Paracoccus sp. (in: a-proteobacteria)]